MSFSSGLTNDVVKVRTSLDDGLELSPTLNLNKQSRTSWRPRSETDILQMTSPPATIMSTPPATTTTGTITSTSWPWMSFAVFRKGVYTINNNAAPVDSSNTDKGRSSQSIPVDITRRGRVGSARSNSLLNSQVSTRANVSASSERSMLISAGSVTPAQREVNGDSTSPATFTMSAGIRRRPMSGNGMRSKFGRRYRLATANPPRPDSTNYPSTITPQAEIKITTQRNGTGKEIDRGAAAAAALAACRAKLVAEAEANLQKNQDSLSTMETVKDNNYLVNISSASTVLNGDPFKSSNSLQETFTDDLTNLSAGKPNSMTTVASNHHQHHNSDNSKSTLSFSYMNYINGNNTPSVSLSQTIKSSTPVHLTSSSNNHNNHKIENLKRSSSVTIKPLLPVSSEESSSVLVSPNNGTDTFISDHTSYISQQTKPLIFQHPSTASTAIELNRRPSATQITVSRQSGPTPEVSSTELIPLKSILKKNTNNSFSSTRYISAGSRRIGAGGSLRLVDNNSSAETRAWTPNMIQAAKLPVSIPQRSFSVGPRSNFLINRSLSVNTPSNIDDSEKLGESLSRASLNAISSRPTSASRRGVRFNMDNTAVFEYEQPEKHSEILPNSLTDDDQWYRMMWHKLAGY